MQVVTVLSSEEGGRTRPLLSGYGPQVRLGAESTSCIITGENPEYLFDCNQEHEALFELRFPKVYAHVLKVGDCLEFLEGSRKVGEGLIIE